MEKGSDKEVVKWGYIRQTCGMQETVCIEMCCNIDTPLTKEKRR